MSCRNCKKLQKEIERLGERERFYHAEWESVCERDQDARWQLKQAKEEIEVWKQRAAEEARGRLRLGEQLLEAKREANEIVMTLRAYMEREYRKVTPKAPLPSCQNSPHLLTSGGNCVQTQRRSEMSDQSGVCMECGKFVRSCRCEKGLADRKAAELEGENESLRAELSRTKSALRTWQRWLYDLTTTLRLDPTRRAWEATEEELAAAEVLHLLSDKSSPVQERAQEPQAMTAPPQSERKIVLDGRASEQVRGRHPKLQSERKGGA